jgi:hypothetical protein
MQMRQAEEARKAALAAPQLAEATAKAGSARHDFVVKAVGHALHTSVNNPTDETLDQAARTLAGVGLNPAEINREITPIKQLPLDQRKGALMQSILSDPNSKAAFEATLPKPKEMRLGDRTILIDENPLSSTFNQPIRTEMVGVSPNTVFNKTMRGAAPARVSGGGGGGGGVPSGRSGAAPAAGGGGRGESAAQQPAATGKAKERADAAQALYDIIVDAQKKGHLVSEKQTYVANRAQEILQGRTYLPGGTAQKTSIDELDAAAAQLARSFVEKGTSGTLNAIPEMQLFLKSVGGGDATYEARMRTLRNFAKQHGIKLNDYANKPSAGNAPAKPAANIGKPPPGVSATEWQYMTPEERKEMLK